jgi:hypothetical protein
LLKGISPAYRLTVETEKSLEALPVSARVETAHALDVKRESGLVALRGGEELTLSVEAAQEMQRVDAEEFARTGRTKAEGFVSVFRFLKPDYDLRARAETVQPQIEAQVRNHVRVAADQLSVSATIDYSIKRAGVFTLRLALPAGYRVEHVTGAHVQQWNEHDGRLEVALKERTLGNFTLRVELSRSQRELPETTAIVGVLPLDTSKLTGFVSVLAEAGVAVKTAAFEGLSEIPAISLPDGASLAAAGVLAYKFISTAPQTAPPWSLSVNTESVAAWVRAEVAHSFTIGETLVSGRAQVRFDVANAPVKELNLKIPAALKNVEITGPNIRRRDQQGEIWRIELQNKVRGNYTLTVNWEQARDSKTNRVELIPIAAERVERETGLLAIAAKAPLQVAEIRAVELTRVDTGEFPEWAGRPDDGTVLAYRYVRAGHQLALEARRFDEAAVLQALADSLRLTTVVSEDGQAMTELAVSVRNNGRQFLEIELPAGAEVWSAFVAGQPVRPSKREGKLLLPLQEWGADDEAVTVELTYAGTNAFPRVRGALNFVSPKLDVPLKNARWELFLPQDFAYEDFAGTMTREIAASPSILNFSLSEYLAKEKSSWAQYKEEAKKDVSKAQSNLSSGNLRGAVQDYNRAKGKYRAGKDEAGEVQKLELQLRNFQATNLVNAQQAFSSANNGVMTVGQVDLFQNPVGNNLNYDNAAAEAQWTKLAQAQEVAAAKVQPLRVNLPLRGLRYSFTQVLQTEVNKPLTVHFSAANAKTGSWLTNAGLALVGFLALWALMAAFTGSKFSHRPATA